LISPSFYSGNNLLSFITNRIIAMFNLETVDFASGDGSGKGAIVQAIVTLAQQLGLRVVAEEVETQEELELLRRLGCDLVQGFLFSKPMPVEACEKFLRGAAASSLHGKRQRSIASSS
jgi:predicted signal transduction protein with EAL and GGDEF domain